MITIKKMSKKESALSLIREDINFVMMKHQISAETLIELARTTEEGTFKMVPNVSRSQPNGTINQFKLKKNDPKAFDCHDGSTRYMG